MQQEDTPMVIQSLTLPKAATVPAGGVLRVTVDHLGQFVSIEVKDNPEGEFYPLEY